MTKKQAEIKKDEDNTFKYDFIENEWGEVLRQLSKR